METMLNIVVFSNMLARSCTMCAILYIRFWNVKVADDAVRVGHFQFFRFRGVTSQLTEKNP